MSSTIDARATKRKASGVRRWVLSAWSLHCAVFLACAGEGEDGGFDSGGPATSTFSTETSGNGDTTVSTDADSSSTTSTNDSGGTATETSTGVAEDTSSTGASILCEFDDHFMCEDEPWECPPDGGGSSLECGGAAEWFGDDGCLRKGCEDGALCPDGTMCFSPNEECGICFAPRPFCDESEAGGELRCSCSQDGGCSGRVCVPLAELGDDPCARL
jgi:hypothetical protein